MVIKFCPFILKKVTMLKNTCVNLQLYMLMISLLLFQFLFLNVKAQSPPSDYVPQEDVVSHFRPSLAVVIGILSIMFSLTFLLLLYAKFCHRNSSSINIGGMIIQDGLLRSSSRFSGIDKTVVESLPFFRFSALKGSKQGLECAVCLSKFEHIEILRLLPKCKHAFHIDCIDQWLEKHSSCPLCRQKVSIEDVSILKDSVSMRFLWNGQSDIMRDESNLELYVEREESHSHGSSRFSIIGGSFRKSRKAKPEEELPIQESIDDGYESNNVLHKLNHKIVISDVVLKHRWSNVSASDLLFLNSEMLSDISSNRFSALDMNNNEDMERSRVNKEGEVMDIKEEMEIKRLFESKFSQTKKNEAFPFSILPSSSKGNQGESSSSKISNSSEKRSMSEIIVQPRFTEFNIIRNNGSNKEDSTFITENFDNVREAKMRRLWLPIAKRTIQWFANRERRSSQIPYTRQSSNV
ncbi:ubiquitin-protein ligase [Lithospermum erythrorhizon]|uniref:RING-type E3 ubiquitin transferase n=1 Tax=Lithospermum erythrorhizon TaxID=34254 RepID=A0AAV3Q9V7_LITER